jgi:hypothetical protein
MLAGLASMVCDPAQLSISLVRSESFWVSFDLYKLTRHVAERLDNKSLRDATPPARDGFVLLDRPAGLSREEERRFRTEQEGFRELDEHDRLRIVASWWREVFQAFSWHLTPQGVTVYWYSYVSFRSDGDEWSLGFPVGDQPAPRRLWPVGGGHHYPNDEVADIFKHNFLIAFWLLCEQRITRTATALPERHARRRSERAGVEVENVKVITLRREESQPKAVRDQPLDIPWSHRWVVDEHIRNQWYPSLGMHLPITINPYVKGPEDKPLVIKDRVYQVNR